MFCALVFLALGFGVSAVWGLGSGLWSSGFRVLGFAFRALVLRALGFRL